MATRIHVTDISHFEEAFGTLGLHVGSRTGADKRTQDEKEWYVVRRFVREALLANVFATPTGALEDAAARAGLSH